jgi:LTXXQ motif family protein
MFSFTHPAARAATAAVTLLGTIVFANPLYAAGALSLAGAAKSPPARQMLAQAAAPAAMTPAAAQGEQVASSDRIEGRIKDLHKRLHITAAQDSQWNGLAQVMRDNAKAMVDLQQQQAADTQSMNAVDVVKSYGAVIEAHEAGMKKFIPAFETLYSSMSVEQKKTADSLFRSRKRATAKRES